MYSHVASNSQILLHEKRTGYISFTIQDISFVVFFGKRANAIEYCIIYTWHWFNSRAAKYYIERENMYDSSLLRENILNPR